jgi:hypothetical protein
MARDILAGIKARAATASMAAKRAMYQPNIIRQSRVFLFACF